jgi:hypothetical protein
MAGTSILPSLPFPQKSMFLHHLIRIFNPGMEEKKNKRKRGIYIAPLHLSRLTFLLREVSSIETNREHFPLGHLVVTRERVLGALLRPVIP